jgi:RimJ/RimL family protein N-acetyltransferase
MSFQKKASIRVLEKNDMKKKGEVNEYHKMFRRYRNSLNYVIRKSNREIIDCTSQS